MWSTQQMSTKGHNQVTFCLLPSLKSLPQTAMSYSLMTEKQPSCTGAMQKAYLDMVPNAMVKQVITQVLLEHRCQRGTQQMGHVGHT